MSHIDVREIKLNLRYPNSRQEDITDAFMRGYQGAMKIGNDAVRRVKAEKETLIRRIDELCAENERLRNQLHDQPDTAGHNFVRNAREYKRVCDENDKLRRLVKHLHECEEHDDCEGCEYEADDVCDFEHDMQELGIEAHVKEDE